MAGRPKRVKIMSDGGAADVVRLVSAEEDPSSHNIFIHFSSSSFPLSLTVCAPATLLVKIPYFATQLAQPWIDSPPQKEIALECTPGSCPEDYLQCLRFLTSSSSPTSWPPRQASVSEVLQILPVADHLLFQECWDTCMAVLASSPWSIDEEDAIRATISNLNMEPSPDIRERLDTSHDGVALEDLFRKMLTSKSSEDSFVTWCQRCLNHASAPFAAAFHSILFKVMESFSGGRNISMLPREWYVLAKIFLGFTDAQHFILYLVNSEGLLEALSQVQSVTRQEIIHPCMFLRFQALAQATHKENDACCIFKQVLEKVEKRVVLLTNSERARLVKMSKRGFFSSAMDESTMVRLAETLPFGDAARMTMVESDEEVLTRWISHVSHRVSHMDEAGLKAVCEKFENFNRHVG